MMKHSKASEGNVSDNCHNIHIIASLSPGSMHGRVLVSNLSSERRVTCRVLAPLLAELELGSELQGLP